MRSTLVNPSRLGGSMLVPCTTVLLSSLLPCVAAAPDDFLIYGWGVVVATVVTTFPWAVVSVWDAIDIKYRSRHTVAVRLAVATVCLIVAYTAGLLFAIFVAIAIATKERDKDRYDELATIIVLLIFNIYHVARNVRGWTQFFALQKLKPSFARIESQLYTLLPEAPDYQRDDTPLKKNNREHGLSLLRISERLIDNDWRLATPLLNPRQRVTNAGLPKNDLRAREAWGVAMWRAWWTQQTHTKNIAPADFTAPPYFRTDGSALFCSVQDINRSEPSALKSDTPVIDEATNTEITTTEQYIEALKTYGTPEGDDDVPPGQQDTHGNRLPTILHRDSLNSMPSLIYEKTHRIPNRMSALWYNTFRFETLYETMTEKHVLTSPESPVILPTFRSWRRLAHDITTHLDRPVPLSDSQLTLLAGELASTSMLLTIHTTRFAALVEQVYNDGLCARWTFGWSGLLACFSCLWTRDRVFLACLNGLSLLALDSVDDVTDLDKNVRSMLYGYAAFEVSDRAVGPRMAKDRRKELLRRYTNDKGKTCRGSGVAATRAACRELGLPTEASHMDGLPAFSTGWLLEYLEGLPGNQAPAHGRTHDEIESNHGSSNAWRYPHSHN